MRLYSKELLDSKTPRELKEMLDNVKTSNVLTKDEQEANIGLIESEMGIIGTLQDAIAADIKAGQADFDDADGY